MFADNKDFEVVKHGVESILKINYLGKGNFPSIEDDGIVMRDTVKRIVQNPSITKIIFVHNKNYEYEFDQVRLLKEIGEVFNLLSKQKELFTTGQILNKNEECMKLFFNRYTFLQNTIVKDLPADPIGAYVKIKRKHRDYKFEKNYRNNECVEVDSKYENALKYILTKLEELSIIKAVKSEIEGFKVGDRKIYKKFFEANIKPNFIYTSLQKRIPIEARELDSYNLEDAKVTIFELDNEANNLYHLTPLEFTLSEDKYAILNLAKEVISEHKPESNDFIDPQRLREVFHNIAMDLIEEIAEFKNVKLKQEEVEDLANVLIRYTVGFGLVETLLEDERVQDISINAPANKTPIFLTHSDFEDCKTNIIPEQDEVEGWASRLRMISGKPLDASNPILDAEIETPHARARVSVVGKPLNPYGLGFSFRRHRDKPWTLPLFIKNNMISYEAAGLLSFIIDGARTILIAGTRGSGKSSFLTALMVEIMRKYRMITVEDSVTGNCELLIKQNKKLRKINFEELFKEYNDNEIKIRNGREIVENPNFEVQTINKSGKIHYSKSTSLIRHKVNKPIFKLVTATGREIKITGDHSLFTIGEKIPFKEIKTKDLKEGSFIVTPNKTINKNLSKSFFKIDKKILEKENIFVKLEKFNREEIKIRAKKAKIPKSTYNAWFQKNSFPIEIIKNEKIESFKLSKNSYQEIPFNIELDSKFLEFVGLWIADGCYDEKSIIMSVSSKEEQDLVKLIAKKFKVNVKVHSDKFSLMINSKTLKFVMQELMELNGNAYTKKIPNWIFNLSQKQINSVLRGFFSGDGCVGKYEVITSLASEQLLKDIQTLMLNLGIIFRVKKIAKKGTIYPDRTDDGRISGIRNCKLFEKHIGFLQDYKNKNLSMLTQRKVSHENSEIVPLPLNIRKEIHNTIKNNKIFNSNDYIIRKNNIGIKKLKKIVKYLEKNYKNFQYLTYLKELSESDIFWDRVIKVKVVESEEYVYDISVPENENFVTNNILAHNTLEIPTLQLADLGYNIQPMSVRSALSISKEGLSADMGIRSTLRLGDSCLIVGEVRSTEALALYEAMRVGALANVVAGTIHGDSPYGVYDRLVNDLGVPNTSFKATDIIIVANPVKSSDGLHRMRRITQITEVRKKWEKDPSLEGGFQDLFKYDSKTDRLEITDDLINGESDVLKAIGGNVKQWAGNWDAIWDNITLRANIKKHMVDVSVKIENDEILEAEPVIAANDMFHKISEKVSNEYGYLDSKKIFFEFKEWYKDFVKHFLNERKILTEV